MGEPWNGINKEDIPLAGKAIPKGCRDPSAPFQPGEFVAMRCSPKRRMVVIDGTIDVHLWDINATPAVQGFKRQHLYRLQIDDGKIADGAIVFWQHNLLIPYEEPEEENKP